MLAAGSLLGPYRILSALGAGGMGEVYRARDTRLHRDVALKVIRGDVARDSERIRRFEHEARAAGSLSHSHVCAVFDIGVHDGSPYVVMELLEGETLRARLCSGPVPVRKAIDWAAQAAHGLAAAHEKGIVHRDLKPENLFLTRDGQIKVLDFGLAKLVRPEAPGNEADATVSLLSTETGAILGTAGYMAPEQVRGEKADARTDIFALGVVLYELVTGRHAFRGTTYVETGNAILHAEPGPLESGNRRVTPGLEPIVMRCLEKSPGERFQSAQDLAFALEAITSPGSQAAANVPQPRGHRVRRLAGALGLVVIAAVAGALIGARFSPRPLGGAAAGAGVHATYRPLTFDRGVITAARFAADGQSVVLSAAWEGRPLDVSVTQLGGLVPRSLDLPPAHLFAVSRTGSLALMLGDGPPTWFSINRTGTLAEVSASIGAPHPLSAGVGAADWFPDGRSLAVVRDAAGTSRLEFPAGHPIYTSPGDLDFLRVAPSGDRVAFLERLSLPNVRGRVIIADARGRVIARSAEWRAVFGLAWTPDGGEVWYGCGDESSIRAISTADRDRTVQTYPGHVSVLDIARDGSVLMAKTSWNMGIRGRGPRSAGEIELGWLDYGGPVDFSADGRTLIFVEQGYTVDRLYWTCLRGADGSAPTRLGSGWAQSLSPDGRQVLAIYLGTPQRLMLIPTGIGSVDTLPATGIEQYTSARWMSDGKHIVFSGSEPGKAIRTYVQDIREPQARPVTPDGVAAIEVSADGRRLAGNVGGQLRIFPTSEGESKSVAPLEPDDMVVRWSDDGNGVFVCRPGVRGSLDRIDVRTGTRSRERTLSVPDAAGVWIRSMAVSPDGRSYAFGYLRWLDELYVVQGLK